MAGDEEVNQDDQLELCSVAATLGLGEPVDGAMGVDDDGAEPTRAPRVRSRDIAGLVIGSSTGAPTTTGGDAG